MSLSQVATFQQLSKEFSEFSCSLVNKFSNSYASQSLSRKNISQLLAKIYPLVVDTKDGEQNKDIFLKIVQSQLTNFINNQIILDLIRCSTDEEFAESFCNRWRDYKYFVFSFFTLLLHAKDYYQTRQLTELKKSRGHLNSRREAPVLPVPAVSVQLFFRLVLNRFRNRIKRIVLKIFQYEREQPEPLSICLPIFFEVVWSCSLMELARISHSKEKIFYFKEDRKEMTLAFKQAADNELFIKEYLLGSVVEDAANHYALIYREQLSVISALEQINTIHQKCSLEERIAEFCMPSPTSMNIYLETVYCQLILNDFDNILNKRGGFRQLLTAYSLTENEHEKDILIYFDIISKVESKVIDRIIRVISEIITEKGADIRSRINHPKEFVKDILNFKKSIRRIFDFAKANSFKAELTMEKGFKKLMEGSEASRALAEFTDFTVKECLRLKLDDVDIDVRFRQVLFLLGSVSAKDLFLAYHQDLMSKRLLDGINEPKTEIEMILLQMLADDLGTIMLTPHFSMIKDIQNSLQTTQYISKLLPFASYKWDLRIVSAGAWPDSALKGRFAHIHPPNLLHLHMLQIQKVYQEYRHGLSLRWKLERGTSLFQGHFSKGKFRFQAENIYMIILLHISEQAEFKMIFSDLKGLFSGEKENENRADIINYLKVLLQQGLILRDNKKDQEDFQLGDCLRINLEYKPQKQKAGQIVMVRMSAQLTKQLNQNSVEINKVVKDRERLIDALLVKVLKHAHSIGSNRVTFAELYMAINTNPYLSNFNFSQTVVKQHLQQLILKQYCQRDENDRRVYHYIA